MLEDSLENEKRIKQANIIDYEDRMLEKNLISECKNDC